MRTPRNCRARLLTHALARKEIVLTLTLGRQLERSDRAKDIGFFDEMNNENDSTKETKGKRKRRVLACRLVRRVCPTNHIYGGGESQRCVTSRSRSRLFWALGARGATLQIGEGARPGSGPFCLPASDHVTWRSLRSNWGGTVTSSEDRDDA